MNPIATWNAKRRAKAKRLEDAILYGFTAAGLRLDHAALDDYDLLATGKFHEVAYYAGQQLGIDLRTVGDLKALLTKAR